MAANKPKYRGQVVNKIENKVSGHIGHPTLNRMLDPGEEVVVILTGQAGAIGFVTTADGTVCRQTIKAMTGYIVTDDLDGADVLHKLHAQRVEELDALLGTSDGAEPDE